MHTFLSLRAESLPAPRSRERTHASADVPTCRGYREPLPIALRPGEYVVFYILLGLLKVSARRPSRRWEPLGLEPLPRSSHAIKLPLGRA